MNILIFLSFVCIVSARNSEPFDCKENIIPILTRKAINESFYITYRERCYYPTEIPESDKRILKDLSDSITEFEFEWNVTIRSVIHGLNHTEIPECNKRFNSIVPIIYSSGNYTAIVNKINQSCVIHNFLILIIWGIAFFGVYVCILLVLSRNENIN